MKAFKSHPPIAPKSALRNCSFEKATSFVEDEFLDSFLGELSEFVEKRVAELIEKKRLEYERCKGLILEQSTSPGENVWADIIEGASLAFNPCPVRNRVLVVDDLDALQSDWVKAFTDANRVWHTIEFCTPNALKPNDERRTRDSTTAPT